MEILQSSKLLTPSIIDLPDLFDLGPCFGDMPSLEDLSNYSSPSLSSKSVDTMNSSTVDEVIDFFVDPCEPTKLLMSRAGVISPAFPAFAESFQQAIASNSSQDLPIGFSPRSMKRLATPVDDEPSDKTTVRRERNRLAAERCRQRRSNLITTLQTECAELRAEKKRLQLENHSLLEALRKLTMPPLQ